MYSHLIRLAEALLMVVAVTIHTTRSIKTSFVGPRALGLDPRRT